MQDFLNQHLTPRNEKVIIITFIVVLEIVLMASFGALNNAWASDDPNSYGAGWALQLVQAIFFFIGYLVLGFLQFFNNFQQLTWVLIGNTSFLGLGVLLGLVGMAITSKFFADIIKSSTTTYFINYPVGFWFVQLMIFFVALMFEYKLHQNIPSTKVQDIKNVPPPQQPVQYYAQQNLSFQQNQQGIQFTGQQLNTQPQ